MQKDISSLRREFSGEKLDEALMPKLPSVFFTTWLNQALECKISDTNAFTLSTIDENNYPQARVLLLKDYKNDSFIFYTNYSSAKAEQIDSNPKACALFFWQDLFRQIRITGQIEKLDDETSSKYFATRPKASKIGALASNQSSRTSTAELKNKYAQIEKLYENTDDIPKPDNWGGYILKADYYEFWQGQAGRFHDRICYKRQGENLWDIYRIAP